MGYDSSFQGNKYRLIITYIILSPIVDLLTGICIHRFHMPEGFLGSPSQLFRILYLILFVSLLTRHQSKICLIIFFWILSLETMGFILVNQLVLFLSGLNYAIKILFIVLLYYSVNNAISNGGIAAEKIAQAYLNSSTLYALGVIIPAFLGVGAMTYNGAEDAFFGQRGLFASGNALGIYLGVAGIFAVLKAHKNLINIQQSLLIVFALLLVGTKTALCCLAVLLFVFLYVIKSKWLRVLIVLILSVIVFTYLGQIIDTMSQMFEVVFFRFDKSETLLAFLASGREMYIRDAFEQFFQSPIWMLKFLVGGGAFLSFRPVYTPGMLFDQLEMDFFDVFFMYGLVGLCIYCCIICNFLVKSQKKSKWLFLVTLLFCIHSLVVGHIIFDGMSMISGVVIATVINYFDQFKSSYRF